MTVRSRLTMQFSAPAKINLGFRILGKRADGFHEIETLMARLSLADTIEIDRPEGAGLHFECSDKSLPVDSSNLVVKAVESFRRNTGIAGGLAIRLEKRIPHGAGLAGGSSDAASTLMGLNELFEARLSLDALSEMAAELGSDIPFFLHESTAMCRGRGEMVEPVEGCGSFPVLLIKPGFGVATPWAYGHWADSREVQGFDYSPQRIENLELVNDLERPVFEKFPFLGLVKNWLIAQSETRAALMSGSGSTMFCIPRSKEAGATLLNRARDELGGEFWAWRGTTL